MAQGRYIFEDTQDLIIRARQILGNQPNQPTSYTTNYNMSLDIYDNDNNNNNDDSIHRSSLSHVVLKNVIEIIDSSIIICTGPDTTTCAPPAICATENIISPNKYVNMVTTVNLKGVAQKKVVIQFSYLINEIPITDPSLTQVTVDLIPGDNTVYLFPTNHIYSPSTSITLYGASVVSK